MDEGGAAGSMFPQVSDSDGWAMERRGTVIVTTIKGNLGESYGRASAAKCVELMGHDRVHLLGDLLELENYESGFRAAWQKSLLPHRDQIGSITVGAKKPLVRMGVTAFGLFLGIPVEVVRTRAELERWLEHRS